MIALVIISISFILVVWAFMQQPQFGKTPSGARQARIEASPNFRDGAFQNLNPTPQFTDGANFFKVSREFFFGKSKRTQPTSVLPAEKVNLTTLNPDEDVIVWFGHSSYFIQLSGKRLLIDPVLSGNASPLSFTTRSFKGTDVYTADDLPEIDFLFISHDHYDHLDYKTVKAIRPKVRKVITALGVGAHLERWGYEETMIEECDWHDQLDLGYGFIVQTAPARHFSGRGFKRGTSLWTSFALTTPKRKIYLGGDSGYDTHFAEIGEKYGPFDLAILENGQYNKSWKHIHMMPEETVQAAFDLKATKLFPVHWSKFALSLHDWDDSIKRVVTEAEKRNMPVMHPSIGRPVNLNENTIHERWWESYQ